MAAAGLSAQLSSVNRSRANVLRKTSARLIHYPHTVTGSANELMPRSLRQARGTVFHYTSAQGLLGIVRVRMHVGLRSNEPERSRRGGARLGPGADVARLQNDAIVSSKAAGDDDKTHRFAKTHEVFVLSASTAADDVNQWRLYAQGGNGYAIGLRARTGLAAVSSAYPPSPAAGRVRGMYFGESVAVTPWYHVFYDSKRPLVVLKELVRAYDKALKGALRLPTRDDYDETIAELEGMAYEALATIAVSSRRQASRAKTRCGSS